MATGSGKALDPTTPLETRALIAAAERLSLKGARRRPSPSSVSRCTRANWFGERGYEGEPMDSESYISARSGSATENIIDELVEEAGLGAILYFTPELPLVCGHEIRCQKCEDAAREFDAEALAKMAFNGGQLDRRLDVGGDKPALLEYKRKGAFGILDLWRSGLRETNPDEFTQVQSMMHMADLDACLYIAVNWDRSALTSATRKYEYRPSGIYTEWVKRSPVAAKITRQRAEMQSRHIAETDNPKDVPRDYNPIGSDRDWQCSWCPMLQYCLFAEGVVRGNAKKPAASSK